MLVGYWYLGDGVLSGDGWHYRLQFAILTTTYGRLPILSGDLERRQWPWRSSCGGRSADGWQLGSWSSVTAALVQVETLFVVQHCLIQFIHQMSYKSLEWFVWHFAMPFQCKFHDIHWAALTSDARKLLQEIRTIPKDRINGQKNSLLALQTTNRSRCWNWPFSLFARLVTKCYSAQGRSRINSSTTRSCLRSLNKSSQITVSDWSCASQPSPVNTLWCQNTPLYTPIGATSVTVSVLATSEAC